jgi:hypothetical protein
VSSGLFCARPVLRKRRQKQVNTELSLLRIRVKQVPFTNDFNWIFACLVVSSLVLNDSHSTGLDCKESREKTIIEDDSNNKKKKSFIFLSLFLMSWIEYRQISD